MQRETKYDLKGQRFGKLTVIERVDDIEREWNGKRISRVAWLCKCDCGRTKIGEQGSLLSGRTKTCGSNECRKGRRVIRNTYDLNGEFGKGWTKNGVEFWFDKEDYDLIKDYNWCEKDGYITAITWNYTDGSQHKLRLHRLIMRVENIKDFNNKKLFSFKTNGLIKDIFARPENKDAILSANIGTLKPYLDLSNIKPGENVLYVEYYRVCRTQLLHWDDLGYRRPHCRRDKGEGNS